MLKRSFHIVIAVSLIILLLSLTVVAVKKGIASIYENNVFILFKKFKAEGFTASDLDKINEHMLRAATLADNKPQLLLYQGKIQMLQSLKARIPLKEANAHRKTAKSFFKQALLKEPNNPYTWLNLTLCKVTLKEFDAEFDYSLERINDFAHSQLDIQKSIIHNLFMVWYRLSDNAKESVLESVKNLLSNYYVSDEDRKQLNRLLTKTSKKQLVCSHLSEHYETRVFCQNQTES